MAQEEGQEEAEVEEDGGRESVVVHLMILLFQLQTLTIYILLESKLNDIQVRE